MMTRAEIVANFETLSTLLVTNKLVLIKSDGTMEGKGNANLPFDEVAKLVAKGDLIERFKGSTPSGMRVTCWVDESGLLKRLPINPLGTLIYGTGHPIAGDILLCHGIQGVK